MTFGAGPRLALVGGTASVATVLCASRFVDPSARRLLGSWFGLLPDRQPAGTTQVALATVITLSVLTLVAVWALTVRAAALGKLSPRAVWLMFAAWAGPFALGPPLFSRDVYAYAAQGQMLVNGIDPYRFGPSALPPGALTAAVDPRWRNARAPYGPLGLWIEKQASSVVHDSPLATVLTLRGLAVASVVLIALLSVRLGAPRPAAAVLALFALNPVVLMHLVSGAHLEAVMVALLLAGVALRRAGHSAAGIVFVTGAGAIKAPALLALGCFVVLELYEAHGLRERALVVLRDTAAVALTWLVLAALVPNATGWVDALNTPGAARTLMTPAIATGSGGSRVLASLGLDVSKDGLIALSIVVYAGVATLLIARLLLTAVRRDLLRTVGFTLLCVAVLGPVSHPWYLIWGFACLIPAAAGGAVRTRVLLLVLSGLAALTELPSARGAAPDRYIMAAGVTAAVLALAITGWAGWSTWGTRPGGPAAPDKVPAGGVST